MSCVNIIRQKMNKLRTIAHHPLTIAFLIDILSVYLLFVACTLIGETILPSIIYRYISPVTIYGILFFLCTITAWISRVQNTLFSPPKMRPQFIIASCIFFVAMIAIAALRYGPFLSLLMVFFAVILFIIAYALYRDMIHRS